VRTPIGVSKFFQYIIISEKAKSVAIAEASKTYLSDPEILEKVVASIQDPNFKLNRKLSSFKQHVVSKINRELADSGFSFNQT
jgi:hypothetical protein